MFSGNPTLLPTLVVNNSIAATRGIIVWEGRERCRGTFLNNTGNRRNGVKKKKKVRSKIDTTTGRTGQRCYETQ